MKPLLPSNHSNFVTQKHAAVTCSVSSSLARIADAEWTRCCERVRKSSPQIGSLGEWRSLCDSGWMGKVPDDLPDAGVPVATGPSSTPLPVVEEELGGDTDLRVNRTRPVNTNTGDHTPSNLSPVLPPLTTDSDQPQRDPITVEDDVPALDCFPAPPVHFPLPHLQRVSTNSLDRPIPSYGRQVTSPVLPVQESPGPTATTPTELAAATATQTPSPIANTWADAPIYLPTPSRSDPNQTLSPADPPTTVLTTDNAEFGIRQPRSLLPSGSLGSYDLSRGNPQSSGVVLAMRNRFAQNVSYDRHTYTIRGAELHSLYLQPPQENLQLRSLVYQSVYRPSPVVINLWSTLHYSRTGLRWGILRERGRSCCSKNESLNEEQGNSNWNANGSSDLRALNLRALLPTTMAMFTTNPQTPRKPLVSGRA